MVLKIRDILIWNTRSSLAFPDGLTGTGIATSRFAEASSMRMNNWWGLAGFPPSVAVNVR